MFQFRVAIALGYPHPDLLLGQLTYKQYRELTAFCSIEPIGDERADIRSGLVGVNVVNALGARPRAKLEQFLPFRDKPEAQSEEDLLRKFEALSGDCRGSEYDVHGDHF